MQSVPSEVIPQNFRTNRALDTQHARRHGFNTQDEYAQDRSVHETGLGEPSRSTDMARSPTVTYAVTHETANGTVVDTMDRSFYKLSSISTSSASSPADRIIEHENAVFQESRRKNEGSTFAIVPCGSGGPSSKISIIDFPNGMQRKVINTNHG
jgi:hypothetical protein